jgi:hypothetical protein
MMQTYTRANHDREIMINPELLSSTLEDRKKKRQPSPSFSWRSDDGHDYANWLPAVRRLDALCSSKMREFDYVNDKTD